MANVKNNKNRMIIVSLDAVGSCDMEYLLSLPNFSKIVENGAYCDNVESVYPSLTYPAHTAIITGKMPKAHRIVNNTRIQPDRKNPDWLYKKKYINGKTIVDIAKEKGYSVCSLLWPVLGGAKIEYNIPEVLVTRKWQTQVTACLANGTPKYLLEVQKRFGSIRNGVSQPELDDFLTACAKYTIEKYDPDMMLIHFTDVDTNKHIHGVDNEYIKAALERHDKRLGDLLTWLSKTRPMDDTTVIVLGDHSQIEVDTIAYPNKVFLDKGYITVNNGKIVDYKAYSKTCDGSAYIYVNEKYALDMDFIEDLTDTLNALKKDERLGIDEIYTGEEASELGADDECFAMLEAKPGFYFLNEFDVLTEKVSESNNHRMYGTHGYLPTKEGYSTFFAAMGKGIKKGARIDKMHLWDEGPTIAKLLGGHLPQATGRVINEILE